MPASGRVPRHPTDERFRIVKRLGGGRSSEALLAVAQGPFGFSRTVVLKRLLPQYEWDPSMGRALATEAIAYARLSHPAIVRLYDFVEIDGSAALVLEHVDGPSLAALQAMLKAEGATLSTPAALYIASRIFAALDAAHGARDPESRAHSPVVHRDVNPTNVLLEHAGVVKLGDFGFARIKGRKGEHSDTHLGPFDGRLGYLAPEQVRGEPVTPSTDVYAACLVLRELLVGEPAFDESAPELELLRAIEEARFAPLETLRPGISAALADALRCGLAREPAARTLTAAQMGAVLHDEIDETFGQMALVDVLAQLRPLDSYVRAAPPAASRSSGSLVTQKLARTALPTEVARAASSASGHAARPTSRGPGPRPAAILAFALGAIGVGAALGMAMSLHVLSGAWRAAAIPAWSATAVHQDVPEASDLDVPVISRLVPPPEPSLGTLLTPPGASAYRVLLDGRYAADRSGAALTVPCGLHTVRIGTRGTDQSVEVPCGGSVAVAMP